MTIQEAVTRLVEKSVKSLDATDAMKFAQAALTAAQAYSTWTDVQVRMGERAP